MKTSKFKMTELGPIPEEWEVKPFSECFTLIRNNTYARECLTDHPGSVANVHYGDVLIKYGAVLDFAKNAVPYLKSDVKPNKDMLRDGDLVFADTAEDEAVGKAVEVQGLKSRIAVAGLHTVASRPHDGLFAPRYLGYYINSIAYHNQLLPLITGTKVSSVSRAGFLSTYVTIPSKSEQEKIAEALSDVDALLSAMSTLIEKKRNIKTGTMQELLGMRDEECGMRNVPRRRLPGFSGEWVEKRLGECGKIVREIENPFEFPNKQFVEYSMPAFDAGKKAQVVLGKNMLSSRTRIQGEVLLFNKLNVRQRRIWYVNACPNNAICSSEFLPYYSDLINLLFLAYILDTEQCARYFIDVSKGTSNSQKRIAPKDFEDYMVLLPPTLAEQQAIAAVLSDMDAEIAALEADRAKYESIKQGMMQELLTGRTRLKGE